METTIKQVITSCPNCKGMKKVLINVRANEQRLITCPICNGTGKNRQK